MFEKKIKTPILMKKLAMFWLAIASFFIANSQEMRFENTPYVEMQSSVDSLVSPDMIYLSIVLSEADLKNKTSVEDLEKSMMSSLEKIGINLLKDLKVEQENSYYQKYFLRGQQVSKTKSFQLLVHTADKMGEVFFELEKIGIANVFLQKTEISNKSEILQTLRIKALKKARAAAEELANSMQETIQKVLVIQSDDTRRGGYYDKVAEVSTMGNARTNVYQAPKLEFQQQTLIVEISVKFALKAK